MMRKTNNNLVEYPSRIRRSEWRLMCAAVKAWSMREAASLSGLSPTAVHRMLRNFSKKWRLRFLPDLKKVNLIMLTLITPKLSIKKAPPFTFTIRDVHSIGTYTLITALIPPLFANKYIDALGVEPLILVKGYEYLRWAPNATLSCYDPSKEAIIPIFDLEKATEACKGPVERWDQGLMAPDIYDLVLLTGRMRDPFARPMKIYREARLKWDPSLPSASEQVLSYHFTRHLKAMWRGNAVTLFTDMKTIPMRLFYFEGRDAPVLARVLCQLPGAYAAMIDVNRALIGAQFPCSYDEYIMQGIEGLDVELVRYFVQSSSDLRKVMPMLWRYVEGRRWVFKEELRVPVAQRLPS